MKKTSTLPNVHESISSTPHKAIYRAMKKGVRLAQEEAYGQTMEKFDNVLEINKYILILRRILKG